MSKRKGQIQIPQNLRQVMAQKERARDKEVERMKSALDRALLIEKHTLSAVQNFINLLTNFVGHDLKNEIHNLDGIISTLDLNDISSNDIETLKSCLDHMRLTIDDFNVITNEREKDEFPLGRLMSSIDLLHRNNFKKDKIIFTVNYGNTNKDVIIKQHFRKILQLFNNLIINSYKALKIADKKEILITINEMDNSNLEFSINDTGCGISEEIKEKIFEPYFTTTNGSGIGLTHVIHTLSDIKGSIELVEPLTNYTTSFKMIIPQ